MAECWLLMLFFAFILPAATARPCHPNDLRALQGFAGNLGGGGVLSLRAAWSGVSCCSWEGVGCDATSGRVTALWLPGRGLAGHIPSSIGELDHLLYLDLSDNSLVGEVPKGLQMHVKRSRRTLAEAPNTISGTNNKVGFGKHNTVSGNDNTVITGNNNTVSGSNNVVVTGSDNVVTGSNQVVSGSNHVVTDNNNHVSGKDNNVSGSFHNVSGSHNTVSGSNNTVSGSNHVVSGSNKVVTDG